MNFNTAEKPECDVVNNRKPDETWAFPADVYAAEEMIAEGGDTVSVWWVNDRTYCAVSGVYDGVVWVQGKVTAEAMGQLYIQNISEWYH